MIKPIAGELRDEAGRAEKGRSASTPTPEAQMAMPERAHRFKIGQTVTLSPGFGYARDAGAPYKIIALLPSNGAHYQYRISNIDELFERVAAENELTPRAAG